MTLMPRPCRKVVYALDAIFAVTVLVIGYAGVWGAPLDVDRTISTMLITVFPLGLLSIWAACSDIDDPRHKENPE